MYVIQVRNSSRFYGAEFCFARVLFGRRHGLTRAWGQDRAFTGPGEGKKAAVRLGLGHKCTLGLLWFGHSEAKPQVDGHFRLCESFHKAV